MAQVTVPSWIPVVGGQTFGDPNPQAPADDTSAREAIIQQFESKYGKQIGSAAPVNDSKNNWQGYHRYTFGDGSTLDITPSGQVVDFKPSTQANQAAASQLQSRQHPDITDKTTGNTYTWDPSSNQ